MIWVLMIFTDGFEWPWLGHCLRVCIYVIFVVCIVAIKSCSFACMYVCV